MLQGITRGDWLEKCGEFPSGECEGGGHGSFSRGFFEFLRKRKYDFLGRGVARCDHIGRCHTPKRCKKNRTAGREGDVYL